MSQSEYFLVLSNGYCGSLWLAASLDKHPDISCSCSKWIGLGIPHDSGFDFGSRDPAAISMIIEEMGLKGIDDLFDRLVARKPAKLTGDVHGYRVATYHDALGKSIHRPANLAHLVRHPVPLLERITQEMVHRYTSFPRIQRLMTQNFPQVGKVLGPALVGLEWRFDTEGRGLGFLYGLNEFYRVIEDVRAAPNIPLWAFEHLNSDREVFASLVSALSNGAVSASEEYLNTIFDPQSLATSGRFRKTGVDMASQPEAIFAKWLPQEQEAFRRVVRAFGLPALYQPVGYGFDFIG